MRDLIFAPLDEMGFSTLRSWFSDPELKRRFEYPTRLWFDYVSNDPDAHAWMILEDDLAVGLLQLDLDTAQTGYIGFYVNPELRQQGYGKRILRDFLAHPEVEPLHRVVATAEVDNLASHRCLEAVGFTLEGSEPDEEGFLHFSKSMNKIGADFENCDRLDHEAE